MIDHGSKKVFLISAKLIPLRETVVVITVGHDRNTFRHELRQVIWILLVFLWNIKILFCSENDGGCFGGSILKKAKRGISAT